MGIILRGYDGPDRRILGLYRGLKVVKWHEFSGVRVGKSNQGYGSGNA